MTDLLSIATPAPKGTRGLDTNSVIRPADADRLLSAGYRFAIRYIAREVPASNDLTAVEFRMLLAKGIGVMPVQHVERDRPPWWTPTDDKGRRYGEKAAELAHAIGFPRGVSVWLDLEGILPGTQPEDVIRYANSWFDKVAAVGYLPGLYVGQGAVLSAALLYRRLKFARYWGAGNLNVDQYPATRGICMKQHWPKSDDIPDGITLDLDVDTVSGDALGGFPMLAAPYQPLPG